MGGSFTAALRSTDQASRVLGVERNTQSLAQAQALGLIDAAVSLQEAAQQADLILIATPIDGLETVSSQLRLYLRDVTVLTDVGSTKAEVVQTARRVLGKQIARFVPGHPIAGAERSGPEAASATLLNTAMWC